MKRSVLGLLLLVMATPCVWGSDAAPHNVKAKIHRDGTTLTFEVVNTSSSSVRINPPLFSSPDVLGHWLFLYDPETKKLQTGWATSFGSMGGHQGSPLFEELKPGQRSFNTFTLEDVLGYFIVVPDCFHIVYVVRLKRGENFVSSAPSNTIYMCK